MAGNCITCSKKLRVDSSHRPHCSRCWLRFTEEGRAFNSAKTKSFYVPRTSLKPRCLSCNKIINTFRNGGYCRICWEGTEEGKKYRAEKVRKSQAKGKNKKPLDGI
jgi:hypothetical protein